MKQLLLVFIIFFLGNHINGQEAKSYENIAFKYFLENVFVKKFKDVKVFELDRKIDFTSNGVSDCMPRQGIDTLERSKDSIINFNYNKRIKRKFSIFDKVFICSEKRNKIVVFKSYLSSNFVIVCISVFGNRKDNFLTFKINRHSMEVEDYCNTLLYE